MLNNLVSYPDETFMDWEFKISVMYDIAKVRLRKTLHHSEGLYSPGVTWSFMAEGESHTNTCVKSQIDDALPNSKQRVAAFRR